MHTRPATPQLDPLGAILVTGGAGFIGSTIVRALVGDGRKVVVLDDLSTGSSARLPASVHLVEHDIAQSGTPEVIERLRPAAIVHAAAQVSVARSMEDPDLDRAINVGGTRYVIEGGRRAGRSRLVFLSSGGAVYGEADGASETWPARPMSPYGHSKLAAEELVAGSGLPYAIARLSNVYGPGQRSDLEGGVVSIFCQEARREREVVIHGDGQQVRDFVFVEDVVDALRVMLDGSRSGTWNVATGDATTVHRLLEIVEQVAGVRIGHRHVDARAGDVRVSRLDIEKSEQELGWRPRTSLEDGLRRTFASDG